MSPKEKAVVLTLALVISGAVAYLVVFAPLGTLGAADGQSYEVDRFGIIGFILFCLVSGYLFVHRQPSKEAGAEEHGAEEHDAEPQECIWPPPPKTL